MRRCSALPAPARRAPGRSLPLRPANAASGPSHSITQSRSSTLTPIPWRDRPPPLAVLALRRQERSRPAIVNERLALIRLGRCVTGCGAADEERLDVSHGLMLGRIPFLRAVGRHRGESSPGVRRNSRSLRQIRTIRTYLGSHRYTIRNGGWISSLRNCGPNSGTILPISGCVRSAPNRSKISSINRSPTSGTSCSAYHCLSCSRSDTADSAKRIVTRGMGYFRPSRFFASVRETSLPASRSASPVTTARMKTRSSSAAS